MKKRVIAAAALLFASAMAFAKVNGDKFLHTISEEGKPGKVLNIYSWNDEFLNRLQNFYPDFDSSTGKIGDVTVYYTVIQSYDEMYQTKLDAALKKQNKAKPQDKVDIFLVEPDYALKYTKSPYTLDMKADLGFTDSDLSSQFQYTKDLGTADGKLKALTWQACPGGLIYRRSMAKEAFGTDDPEKIQALLCDWPSFGEAAEKIKSLGYYMLAGPEDNYRLFYDNAKTPWVVENKENNSPLINIPTHIWEWVCQQKEFSYSERDYTMGVRMWTEKAMTNMGGQGKVFCYFGPTWFIDYVIGPYAEWNQNDNSTGDWAFCKGPESFNWGGTLICAAAGSDNIPLVKDILQKLTCDEKIMERLALETGDFANNEKSMKSVSESGYTNKVLGGQNHIPILIEAAKSIEKKAITNYDATINSILMESMEDYFANRTTENAAWKKFYLGVKEAFPEIGIPVTLEEESEQIRFVPQEGHALNVRSMASGKENNLIFTMDDRCTKIWDAETKSLLETDSDNGQPDFYFRNAVNEISDRSNMDFANGQSAIVGIDSAPKTATTVIVTKDGSNYFLGNSGIRFFKRPDNNCIVCNYEGNLLYFDGGKLIFCDTTTGETKVLTEIYSDKKTEIVANSNEKTFALANGNLAYIFKNDGENVELVSTFRFQTIGAEGNFVFSPSRRFIYFQTEFTLEIYDIENERTTWFDKDGGTSVQFSFDDYTFAVVYKNVCKLYDTDRWETWNEIYGIKDLFCFSPNGKYLLAKSNYGGTKILDLENDEEKTFRGDFCEACMNLDGSRIITYDTDGVVRVYLSETGSLIYSLMADEDGNYIVYTPEGYCDGTEDGIKKYGRAVKGLELQDNRVLVETFYRSDLMKKVP